MEEFMESKELIHLFKGLNLEKQLTLEELPEIDLYMDQVIQLFDNNFKDSKRNEDDKALTKTMINNYAKGKLLMPVKNKKYSKEHLILMSLIYNLKGALSINDIKILLDNIVMPLAKEEEYPIRNLYQEYLNLYEEDIKSLEEDLKSKADEIKKIIKEEDKDKFGEFEFNFLLISSLINMSNMYRKIGEKLIDEYFDKI
jgi:Domain of unknown function (DUF1836)